jgi:hypothetical protein
MKNPYTGLYKVWNPITNHVYAYATHNPHTLMYQIESHTTKAHASRGNSPRAGN